MLLVKNETDLNEVAKQDRKDRFKNENQTNFIRNRLDAVVATQQDVTGSCRVQIYFFLHRPFLSSNHSSWPLL